MEWQAAVILSLVLVVASVTDLSSRRIPNALTGVAGLAGLVLGAAGGFTPLVSGLGAAAVFGLPLLALSLLRPGSFGMGDVKLIAVMGLFMGFDVWPSLLVGLALATAFGLARGIGGRTPVGSVTLPLAPFLAIGVVTAWVAAPTLLQ